jgi:hypothetical protein
MSRSFCLASACRPPRASESICVAATLKYLGVTLQSRYGLVEGSSENEASSLLLR